MLWRAQTFRHLVRLLPAQTILELGCGEGIFTRQLLHVSRGRNAITAATFTAGARTAEDDSLSVEFLTASSLPGPLEGRRFDFVVAMDLLSPVNPTPEMGTSSFKLARVGGAYWRVLVRVRLRSMFGIGAHRTLPMRQGARQRRTNEGHG